MRQFDVVVIGAGAAGMMAAAVAGQRGRSVLIVDHADAPGQKIRISGGGRCNFTNVNAAPSAFLSQNPRFAISALKRYRPSDFIALVQRYGIAFHEKTLGQLFCDGSARQIIEMLVSEMTQAGVVLETAVQVDEIRREDDRFALRLTNGAVRCQSLIIASGGKSIPKMGASGFAYRVADQFGIAVTETRPALVPLTFEAGMLEKFKPLAGISFDAIASAGKTSFREGMLFTHRGVSGPSILQISSYWREGQAIGIDLAPDVTLNDWLSEARARNGGQSVAVALGSIMPRRLADMIVDDIGVAGNLADLGKTQMQRLITAVKDWRVKPVGTEGYRTAEVTLGGIDTAALQSSDMQSRTIRGLYFIGEAVDVTGWLGGYNFQWAWASGWSAGQTA